MTKQELETLKLVECPHCHYVGSLGKFVNLEGELECPICHTRL